MASPLLNLLFTMIQNINERKSYYLALQQLGTKALQGYKGSTYSVSEADRPVPCELSHARNYGAKRKF